MQPLLPCRPLTGIVALALLPLAACGPNRPPVYPVSGQVFYGGKPTPGALVVFHPAGTEDPLAPRPSGQVQEDGSFTLTTYEPGDGAPEGEYDVAIVWIPENAQPNPKTAEVPNRLPPRYAAPQTSGLRVKVEKQTNHLPPFQLTR
ncbi:MAG TPA: hypothetical protein VNK04_14395 [Gemmataceae bacterium]|nr:hypothetical protein [Gemmataceae bacterium]